MSKDVIKDRCHTTLSQTSIVSTTQAELH